MTLTPIICRALSCCSSSPKVWLLLLPECPGREQTAAYAGYQAATPIQGGMGTAAGNQGYGTTGYGMSQQGYAAGQVLPLCDPGEV